MKEKRPQKIKNNEVPKLKTKIWLKCADCQGYFLDGYFACPDKHCPLRGEYPPQRTVESHGFKEKMAEMAKAKKNESELTERILPPVKAKKPKPKKR
jgi:hypothetical protein